MSQAYAQSLLAGAEQAAKLLGVTMFSDAEEIDGTVYVHISHIERNTSDESTKGAGMRVLKTVTAAADANGWVIDIEHMRDEPRLGELYRSLGFANVDTGPSNEIVSMRREPANG